MNLMAYNTGGTSLPTPVVFLENKGRGGWQLNSTEQHGNLKAGAPRLLPVQSHHLLIE